MDSNTQTVTLRSSDDKEFVISSALSTTLKKTLEGEVPLDSETLATVIAYLNTNDDEKRNFDVAEKELGFLKKLIMAAYNLEIRGLLDIVGKRIAVTIEKKSANWIRRELGIKGRCTPEALAEMKRRDPWAWDQIGELEDD